MLLQGLSGGSHLALKGWMDDTVNSSYPSSSLEMQIIVFPTQRMSERIVRAHPFDAKVNKWLEQARDFGKKKVCTICRLCCLFMFVQE